MTHNQHHKADGTKDPYVNPAPYDRWVRITSPDGERQYVGKRIGLAGYIEGPNGAFHESVWVQWGYHIEEEADFQARVKEAHQ